MGPGPALRRPRRRARALRPASRAARPCTASGASASTLGARRRAMAQRVGPGLGRPAVAVAWPTRCGRRLGQGQGRHPQRRAAGDGRLRGQRADDGRRRGRPVGVDEDRVPGRRRPALHPRHGRPQRLLRRARARHGRHGQRPGRPRRHRAPVRLDVPAVRRLHARLGAPVGADGPARRVGLHARLRRAGRGRPDPPAGRAPRGAARDPRARLSGPADANETAEAWRTILGTSTGPAVSSCRARTCPVLADADADGVARGAYVLRDADDPQAVVLVGTGRGGPRRARRGRAAGRRRRPRARGLHAELGALRGPGRRLPRRRAAARPAVRLRRGGHLAGLGPLGRPLRRDRPLRRLGAPGPRSSSAWASRPSTSRRSSATCWPWGRRPRARARIRRRSPARGRPGRPSSRAAGSSSRCGAARSGRGSGACRSVRRAMARRTTRCSAMASAAPRQRRMPPPNGIHVYVPGLRPSEALGPERERLGVDVVAMVHQGDGHEHRRLGRDAEVAELPRHADAAADDRDDRAARACPRGSSPRRSRRRRLRARRRAGGRRPRASAAGARTSRPASSPSSRGPRARASGARRGAPGR